MQEHAPKLPAGLPVALDRPAAIVGGAGFDARLAESLARQGFALIAADGAADELALGGLTPDFVIGDMDSISDADAFAGRSQVIRLDEQETTDLEKCLYATDAPIYVGLGLTGRRFDHTLAAVHAAARYGGSKRLVLVEEAEVVAVARGRFTLDLPKGTRVSIFPLSPIRFAGSSGLRYALDGLAMAQGDRIGTSNAATGEGPVEIAPAPGQNQPYLVIVPIETLEAVLAAMR